MSRLLTSEEITRQLAELPAWRSADGRLTRQAATPAYATGLAVVNEVADEAEVMDHHPEVTLGHRHLAFELTSHDVGGISQRDIELAHRIDAALRARDLA